MVMIECPYVGLDPYGPEQAAFFFARDFERDTIINNMMGARLTVVCGPSGVGKSSILGAGVLHQLRDDAAIAVRQGNRPRFVGCVFPSLSRTDTTVPDELKTWTSEPISAIVRSLQREIALVFPSEDAAALRIGSTLSETLGAWSSMLNVTFLILLDQFEECFLYHERDNDPGRFAEELADAINEPRLGANFLLSIREDALAKLDHFKGLIPSVYGNQLPIDYLDREAAREAVTGPISRYNTLLPAEAGPISIERDLVEAVLDGIRPATATTEVRLVTASPREEVGGDTAFAMDTTYLQLVMTRLWSEEIRSGSRALRSSTLTRLGGVGRLVQRQLDEAMKGLSRSQRRAAARILGYLVTPEGSKIALSSTALADWTGLRQELVASVLLDLAGRNRRVLRSVPGERFELYHDKLAPAVLDWTRMARTREQRARNAGRAARALAILAVLGMSAWGYRKSAEWRRNSERADHITKADHDLSAAYKSLLARDVEKGVKEYDAAFGLYQRFGEQRKALEALLGKAKAYQLATQHDAALESSQKALELADGLVPADPAARGAALERLASLKEATKEIPEAMRLYGEAIQAYNTAQDAQGAGRVQERLAIYSETSEGNKDRAVERYKKARQSYGLAGDSVALVRTGDAIRRLWTWGFLLDLHTGKPMPLTGEEANVGRNDEKRRLRNTVAIEGNRCVSRRHFVIHADDFSAEDWRSRSGTSVNGQPLPYGEPRSLKDRDIIVMANSHAVQFLQSRPATVSVPKSAWGVFVDGAAKRYHYLTDSEYSVSLSNNGFAVAPTAGGEASFVSIRRSTGGFAEMKDSSVEREIYVRYKDPEHDYQYLEGILPSDQWYALEMPAQYRRAEPEGASAAEGAWFQVIPVQPPPGCEDTP